MESLRRLAAAGDQAAQQRIEGIDRIRKKVDSLARKELRLSQQLSRARGIGGGGGGFGGGGGPPGGFGATPPGGDFDKSKGSLTQLSRAMGQLEQSARGGSGAMRELDDLAFEVGKKAAAFRGVAIAINSIVNAAQAAAKFLIQFNDSLLELNKILQLSNNGLQNIGNQLFRLSASTGVAIDQTVEIATAFARAGLSGRGYGSVVSLTQTALVGLQGTTLDATQATTIMIQVIQQIEAGMRGLQKEMVTTSQLFDILGRAEDITASKATDVAAALRRSAASLFATGASMSEVTAIISVLQERTQRGGDVIGTALKTLAARTSNSASEASKALKSIGVETIDAQGNLKNTFMVLGEVADAFGLLTEAEQANIAVKTAGIRQVEVFRAALNDFNRVREVEETLANASGDAARKQAIEQQKLANVIERTKLALQDLIKSASEGVLGQAFDGAIRGAEMLFRLFADLNNSLMGSVATFAH
jgi:TP901 family phage tail tape measure protein